MVWQLTGVLSEHPVLFTIVFADSLQMWWMFLVSCILKAWTCLLKRPRRFLQIRANCMVEIFWNVGHLVFLPRCLYKWVDFPSISGFRMWIPFFCFCCVADMVVSFILSVQYQQSRMQRNSWSSSSKDIYMKDVLDMFSNWAMTKTLVI